MIDGWRFVLTLVTALGCGLVAGFFFAFSTRVMKALDRLPAAQGVAAMQSINVVVLNVFCMGAIFGTGAACIVLVVASLVDWGEPYAVYLLVGGLLYLAGAILLTIVSTCPATTRSRRSIRTVPTPYGTGRATSGVGRRQTMCAPWRHSLPRRCLPSRFVSVDQGPFVLRPIGWVESPLTDPDVAPKQGDEGSPEAWLVFEPFVSEALRDLQLNDEVIVLTWLDRARRDVLVVHPRDDPANPEQGVFNTRSADRPNPIGLHRVEIVAIDGTRLRVRNLEAVDGTPIVDVKPVLDRARDR